jgi:molybdopterin synthase catalytic subunit
MIETWIKEIKAEDSEYNVGMILAHNGIVRAFSKYGSPVKGMRLSYDKVRLNEVLKHFKDRDGIAKIKVWINEGNLKVGDDIMYVVVAGRFRTDIMPVFQDLISTIKKDVVNETEL